MGSAVQWNPSNYIVNRKRIALRLSTKSMNTKVAAEATGLTVKVAAATAHTVPA